jgi:hypothetical protein
MSDACWLPSAIMQTTGAIIGIYMIVYVYAVTKMDRLEERFEGTDTILRKISLSRRSLWLIQILLINIGIITIALNALWLDSLTANVLQYPHKPFSWIPGFGFWSLMFFLITLAWSGFASLSIIKKFT